MKFFKWFLIWCLPGLAAASLLPVAGCFTALNGLARVNGGGPSTPDKVIAGTLDVVTFPVQLVVIGPFAVTELISANTGERGRRKHEARRHAEEVAHYTKILDADFGKVFEIGDFLAPTNTSAQEALGRWLSAYNAHRLSRTDVDRFAERLFAAPELLVKFPSIMHQQEMPQETKERAFALAVKFCRERQCDERTCRDNLWEFTKQVDDTVLRGVMSKADDAVDRVVAAELKNRADRLEQERQRKAAEAKWREEERKRREEKRIRQEVEQKRQTEERLRQWRELKEQAKRLEEPLDVFRKIIKLRNERAVASWWKYRLSRTDTPLPPENIRTLAALAVNPDEQEPVYARELFQRPELTAEDIRRIYPKMLDRLRNGGKIEMAAAMIRNPNCPNELRQASYSEPLLVDFRVSYLFHHAYPGREKSQKFERRCDEWKRACRNGKMTPQKCRTKIFQLTEKYLPTDCPADWVTSIPF